MSTAVDDSGRILDPEAEVRKLQELVAKLTAERDMYLKSKESEKENTLSLTEQQQSIISNNINSQDKKQESDKSNHNANSYDKLRTDESTASLDEVELLDIKSIEELEEEDSWLYTSPRKLSPSQKSVSPYKWVREEFESPELGSTCQSLLFKLDELSKAPSPRSNNNPPSRNSNRGNRNGPLPHASSTGCMPHIKKPLLHIAGSQVDSNTFTRPKNSSRRNTVTLHNSNLQFQSESPGSPRNSPRDTPERNNNAALPYHMDENANGRDDASSGSQESLGGPMHKLEDVMDVQVLARMQEEHLRQSLNAPRKSLSQSLNQSMSGSGLLDCLDASGSSNRSSPGRFDSEIYQSAKRSNNSLASLSSNSTSSPPTSPHGSQYFDPRTQAVRNYEAHRSSLPNLARSYPSGRSGMPSHNSDSRLREQSSPSPTGMMSRSRMQAPSKVLKAPGARTSKSRQLRALASQSGGSPGGMLSPNRQPSPQRVSPHRGLSPQQSQSPQRTYGNQEAYYDRNASPGRTLSPQRNASPGRTLSPQRNISPVERLSPQRQASPGRTLSPQRNAPAQRTASPRRNASPGRTLSPQRNTSPGRVSPQGSGIPTSARTGIPRPASYSKLPTPRRSSIPGRRTSLATPRSTDESWKDGCF